MDTYLEQVKRTSDAARRAREQHQDAVEIRDSTIGKAYVQGGHDEAELVRASGLAASHVQKVTVRAQEAAQRALLEAAQLE